MSLITNVEPLKWDGSTLTRRTLGWKKNIFGMRNDEKKNKKMPSLHNFLNGNNVFLGKSFKNGRRDIEREKGRALISSKKTNVA